MFGYVRPAREQLTQEAWERYQQAYCGLCHSLRGQCGFAARFVLNYDFLFLALLLEQGEDRELCHRRCAAHPVRGRPCLSGTLASDLCAQESVILAYHKLQDGIADEGLFGGLKYRAAALLLTPAYRRARTARRSFDVHVRSCLGELAQLERVNTSQLDRVADTFARLLSGAAPTGGNDFLDRPRQQLLYHLGRWIYLIDALDDLPDDRERGRYNPLTARFGETVDRAYLSATMSHSLALCQSAFQLLDRNAWSDILENILYLGLPNVQRLVEEGKWKSREKGSRSSEL